jgi:hypothetical protein
MKDYIRQLEDRLKYLPKEALEAAKSCRCISCVHEILERHTKSRAHPVHGRRVRFVSKQMESVQKNDLWSFLYRFLMH